MSLFLWIIVFLASLCVLIKASDYFASSAEKIGLYFGMPAFIIGVTIVAVGTSLPELVSSIIAVLKGSSEIVVGNVVGSNVANIFLILGITAIIGKNLNIVYNLINVDLPLLIGSAFLFAVMIWDGSFTRPEALLCIAGLVVYFCYTISLTSSSKTKTETGQESAEKKKLGWKTPAILAASPIFIYVGARYVIESVINISEILNIGKELVAISAVALGTSLPELTVTITAAKRGRSEIAVGNILGSNIFNTFGVMGISGLIGTLIIPPSILTFGLPMMIIATLLYLFITQSKQISQWEGWLLIIFYVLFIGKVFDLF